MSYCGEKWRKSSKKSGGSDKPKQAQRGLGVAQLEQIRLSTQLPSNSNAHHNIFSEEMRMHGEAQSSKSYPLNAHSTLPSTSSSTSHHHPNYMMLLGDEKANLRYQDPQANVSSWNPHNNKGLQDSSTYYGQGGMSSKHPFNQFEESRRPRDSDSSDDHEEVDLELRLSI